MTVRAALPLSFPGLLWRPRLIVLLAATLHCAACRAISSGGSVEPEQALEELFRLTGPTDWPFKMERTTDISAAGPPTCEIVVADARDAAVHWFSGMRPSHTRSVYLGGRDKTDAVVTGHQFAFAQHGAEMVVLDRASSKLTRLRLDGTILHSSMVFDPPGWPRTVHGLNGIAVGPGGEVFETVGILYLAAGATIPAPVRVWDHSGFLGVLGNTPSSDDPVLAAALGMGSLAVSKDTVWLARSSGEHLLAFEAYAGATEVLRRVRVPTLGPRVLGSVLTDSRRAAQGLSDTLRAAVPRYLGPIAVDPSGNFVVTQMAPNSRAYLATLRGDGTGYQSWSIGAVSVRALSATTGVIYAAVAPLDAPFRTAVVAFRNPTYPGAVAGLC